MLLARHVAVALCAVLTLTEAKSQKQGSLFKSLFGGETKHDKVVSTGTVDEDQKALVAWLMEHGWNEYATPDWIEKFDEDIDFDSIEDFAHLVADGDYEEIGIDKEMAQKMQDTARKTVLMDFLKSVPVPEDVASDTFTKLAEVLVAAGYAEPDDLAELPEDEATGMGIDKSHHKTLVRFAEEFDARQIFKMILDTYEPTDGKPYPFGDAAQRKDLVDSLIRAGARSLEDIHTTTETDGLSGATLSLLRKDPRVQNHMRKQEL